MSVRDASAVGRQGGFVLVTVIWLLALLGGLATAMSMLTERTLGVIDVSADRARAAAALTAGLNVAAATVLADQKPAPHAASILVGRARVAYRTLPETARIDLNLAPADLIAGLLSVLGTPSDAATAAAATIVGLRGPPPAAQSQAAAGHPPGYDPDEETPEAIAAIARGGQPKPGERDPHKPFLEVAQLQQVPGVPAAVAAKAAPFLTTFSGKAGIDARLAAPEVLAALPGLTRERLRTILDIRARGDGDALDDALGTAKAETTDEAAPTTRVAVTVTLADGFTTSAEIVIVHFPDDRDPYRVLAWDDDVQTRAMTLEGASH